MSCKPRPHRPPPMQALCAPSLLNLQATPPHNHFLVGTHTNWLHVSESCRLHDDDTVSDDFLGTAIIPLAKAREQKTDHVQVRRASFKNADGGVSCLLPCSLAA